MDPLRRNDYVHMHSLQVTDENWMVRASWNWNLFAQPFRRVSWSRRVLLAAAGGISSWMHDVSGNYGNSRFVRKSKKKLSKLCWRHKNSATTVGESFI
eukprot:scaffold2162_cov75-Skeletonema_marinoi.AAC.1